MRINGKVEKRAGRLVKDVVRRYRHLMDNKKVYEAVVVKCVALVALAYGIPPEHGKELEPWQELIATLSAAEKVLAKCK